MVGEKHFASVFQKNVLSSESTRLDRRGTDASSRTLSAGRDGRVGDAHGFVRTNGAETYGEVVWS
jgi:hypothetical protein